jgi:cobalt/nickel transport system permease protein
MVGKEFSGSGRRTKWVDAPLVNLDRALPGICATFLKKRIIWLHAVGHGRYRACHSRNTSNYRLDCAPVPIRNTVQNAGDWLLSGLEDFNRFVTSSEKLSTAGGFLQGIDPRFKIASAVVLILAAVFAKAAAPLLVILAVAALVASASTVRFAQVFGWVWLPVLGFTGVIAIPAIFTTPGHAIARVPIIGWSIQSEGVNAAVLLVLRAEAATTISALVALTTSWPSLLKALRALRLPAVFVVIVETTHRYLFLLLRTASEMSEARRSRSVGRLQRKEKRRIATATVGVLLSKTFQLSTDVHMAMLSRGFRGDVFVLEDFRARPSDWLWLSLAITFAVVLQLIFR